MRIMALGRGLGALAAAWLVLSGTAQAHHKVYSPIVEGGEFGVESRGHATFDDDAVRDDEQRYIHELEYGVTDRWMTAVFADMEKSPGGPLRYNATAWENIFQFAEQGEDWIDTGGYLEYKIAARPQDADKIEAKLLFEKGIDRSLHRLNLTAEKAFGGDENESPELEYAWQTKWRWRPLLEPGFEAFGKLGAIDDPAPLRRQEHQIGPALFGVLPLAGTLAVRYELGWLFGLTETTPGHTFKWLLELEMYF